MTELQHLQSLLTEVDKDNLLAIVSLTEMVLLRSISTQSGSWEPKEYRCEMEQLYQHLRANSSLNIRLALGNYFPGEGSESRSYCTARTTMKVGKQRMSDEHCYYWQDIKLPVLLDGLRGGWQAAELLRPIQRLRALDTHGVLVKTLHYWFRHNQQLVPTARALFIHKNTLDYRLRRISELTKMNLANHDDRFLLYVAAQLDEG